MNFLAEDNNCIKNRVTGQIISFQNQPSSENDELLMETSYPAFSNKPPSHYHPYQREVFEILSGQLCIRINNKTKILKAGDKIEILPKQKHSMWNASSKQCNVSWKVYPALYTKVFLETLFKLANDGKTDQNGIPDFFTMIYLLKKHQKSFRLSKLGINGIRVLYLMVYPLKRVLKIPV